MSCKLIAENLQISCKFLANFLQSIRKLCYDRPPRVIVPTIALPYSTSAILRHEPIAGLGMRQQPRASLEVHDDLRIWRVCAQYPTPCPLSRGPTHQTPA